MKRFAAACVVWLGTGLAAAGEDKGGLGGDIVAMAEHTTAYPGEDEFGTALFYCRAHYLFEFSESVGAFVEGQVGEGSGVLPELLAPAPDLTRWGVNALAYDSADDIEVRQAYVRAMFGESHSLIAGKVALSELFGANIGGRNAWESFLCPGLVTEPLVPYPAPGFSVFYGVKLAESLSLRVAFGEDDADWDDSFHEEGFYIVEIEQRFGGGRLRGALWSEPQRVPYTGDGVGPGDWTPVGLSLDYSFRLGEFDCFARLGTRPPDLYQVDFAISGGFQLPIAKNRLGFGFVASSWSESYIDYTRLPGAPAAINDPAAEIVTELYYRMELEPGLYLVPDIQVLFCPNGHGSQDPVGVLSLRAHVAF